MASFIYIELDTKPPMVKIFAPSYSTAGIVNTIRIEADENVSDCQEIYAIDANSVRHDYTFVKAEDNLLIGEINFFNFPLGIVTIYATLKDEVQNVSDLASATVKIRESTPLLKLTISDEDRGLHIDDRVQEIHIDDCDKNIDIMSSCRKIEISDAQREVFVDVQ